MGLIAAELESQGIATVCVQTVRHVALRVRPPRSLLVPWKMGHPLGRPNDSDLQHRVMEQMLQVLEDPSLAAPALVEYAGGAQATSYGSSKRELPVPAGGVSIERAGDISRRCS